MFTGERWFEGNPKGFYGKLAAILLLLVILSLTFCNFITQIFAPGQIIYYVLISLTLALCSVASVIASMKLLNLYELRKAARNKHFNYFIKGIFDTTQLKEGLEKSGYKYEYQCFAVLCVKLFKSTDNISDEESNSRNLKLINMCDELANSEYKVAALLTDNDRVCIVLNFKDAGKLEGFIDLLTGKVRKSFGTDLCIGISRIHNDMGALNMAFSEGSEALDYIIIFEQSKSMYYEIIDKMAEATIMYPISEEKQLINSVLSANKEAAYKALDSITEGFAQHVRITYMQIIQIYTQLLGSLIKELIVSGAYNTDLSLKCNEFFNDIHKKMSLKEINLYIHKLCDEFIDYIIYQNNTMNKYCRQVVEYINEHYQQDVSISSVAERLNLSYPYLSKIFKENLKVNFNDYLNSKRIEESKRLLSNTEDSVYEIALKVGYNNDQSFTRFFKKFEGITPGDFRKKSGGGI